MSYTIRISAPAKVFDHTEAEITDQAELKSLHHYAPPGLKSLLEYLSAFRAIRDLLPLLDDASYVTAEFQEATCTLQMTCIYIATRPFGGEELKQLRRFTIKMLEGAMGDEFFVKCGTTCGQAIGCSNSHAALVVQRETIPSLDVLW